MHKPPQTLAELQPLHESKPVRHAQHITSLLNSHLLYASQRQLVILELSHVCPHLRNLIGLLQPELPQLGCLVRCLRWRLGVGTLTSCHLRNRSAIAWYSYISTCQLSLALSERRRQVS